MERKFKIGDRVRQSGLNECSYKKKYDGLNMTVHIIKDYNNNIGVVFDNKVNGHDLDGACRNGYGRWYRPSELKLINSIKTSTAIKQMAKNKILKKLGILDKAALKIAKLKIVKKRSEKKVEVYETKLEDYINLNNEIKDFKGEIKKKKEAQAEIVKELSLTSDDIKNLK